MRSGAGKRRARGTRQRATAARLPAAMTSPAEERLLRAAELARIALDPIEVPALARDLERALAAWSSLRTVDVAGVAPLWTLAAEPGPGRVDRCAPSLPRDELLGNAAEIAGGMLRAPDALGGAR